MVVATLKKRRDSPYSFKNQKPEKDNMTDALCQCTRNTDPGSRFTAYSSRHCKPWSVSSTALEFIAVLESGILNGKNYRGHQVTNGFILQVYKDNKGYPTVGLGHLVTAAENLSVGDTISLKRAQEFLTISLSEIETRFNRDIWLPLYQFEYDALVSVAFNCGAFRGSNALIAQINSGEHGKMFDFLLSYRIGNNAKLKRRRFQEARLFETGIYDATH